jgi:hypothetical protein
MPTFLERAFVCGHSQNVCVGEKCSAVVWMTALRLAWWLWRMVRFHWLIFCVWVDDAVVWVALLHKTTFRNDSNSVHCPGCIVSVIWTDVTMCVGCVYASAVCR